MGEREGGEGQERGGRGFSSPPSRAGAANCPSPPVLLSCSPYLLHAGRHRRPAGAVVGPLLLRQALPLLGVLLGDDGQSGHAADRGAGGWWGGVGGEEKTRGGWGMRGRGEWVRTCALDETMHGQPCRRRAGSGRAGPGGAAARVTRGPPRTERAAARLAASHGKARGAAFCAQGGRWPCALGPGRAPASRRPSLHRAGQKGGRPGGGVPGRRARAGTAAAPPATRRGPTPHCPFAPRIPPPRRRPPSNDTHQGQPGASPARRTRSPGGRGTPWQWVGGWGVGEGAGREKEKKLVCSLSLSLSPAHTLKFGSPSFHPRAPHNGAHHHPRPALHGPPRPHPRRRAGVPPRPPGRRGRVHAPPRRRGPRRRHPPRRRLARHRPGGRAGLLCGAALGGQ